MTSTLPMQMFSAAGAANLDAVKSLTASALKAAESIAVLNLATARSSFDLAASYFLPQPGTGWQDLMARQGAGWRPAAEHVATYFRALQAISAVAQADMAKVVEARVADTATTMIAQLERVEKSAPATARPTIAVVKSTVANLHLAYGNMLRSSRQVAAANTAAMVNAASTIGVAMPSAKERKAA